MALATNYVDDILDGSQNEERVYNLKDADGNIIQANVSIDDVSVYLQRGSVYSAELVNAQNTLLNQLEIDEIKDITITEWNSMSDAQKSAKNYCVVEDGKGKLYVKGKETSGDSITVLSRAEFNALPTAKQNKGAYYIYDADGSVVYNASQTAFDNTGTGMASGNVQQAIEELNSNITFTDILDTATLPRDADRLGGQLPSYYATTDSLAPKQSSITSSYDIATNSSYKIGRLVTGFITVRNVTTSNAWVTIGTTSDKPMNTSFSDAKNASSGLSVGEAQVNTDGTIKVYVPTSGTYTLNIFFNYVTAN